LKKEGGGQRWREEGKNKEIERGEEKTYGETKRILNACCLTLNYLFKL
jgi:hypothetical protein